MPLIGYEMADEWPVVVGLTLIKGTFTTWTELHRSAFRANPESDLVPRVMGAQKDDLHERWMQWVNDAMLEVRESNPQATMKDLERVVKWGHPVQSHRDILPPVREAQLDRGSHHADVLADRRQLTAGSQDPMALRIPG
jgi:hypothetical protein